MAVTINASTSAGLVQTADTSGELALQSGGSTIATVSSAGLSMATGKTLSVGGAVGSPYTMKNRLINGSYDVWQRGTSRTVATGTGNNAFLADRWVIENTSGSTVTASRVANSSNTYGPGNFYINLAIPTFASGEHVDQFQSIEALNIADLAGQTVTLSYFAAVSGGSGATLQLQIWIGFPSTTDNYTSATFSNPDNKTITSTPTRYTSTFTVPSGATTGLRVYVRINNNGSSTSNATTFTLGGVQLEQGSSATSFEWLPFGTELALCQRYYWASGTGTAIRTGCVSQVTTTATVFYQFPVTMRASAAVGFTSLANYNIFIFSTGASRTPTGIGTFSNNTHSALVSFSYASGTTAGATCSLDLANNDQITFSAEL